MTKELVRTPQICRNKNGGHFANGRAYGIASRSRSRRAPAPAAVAKVEALAGRLIAIRLLPIPKNRKKVLLSRKAKR